MSANEMDAVIDAIARIAELDKAIADYPTWWGAALSAMVEERKELTRFVARLLRSFVRE